MKLPEVLEALGQEVPDRETWMVAVLTRQRDDGTADDEILQYPIFDVSVDREDSEINLLTDQDSESPRPSTKALTLGTLLNLLRKLERDCSSYSVFSGSAFVSVDDEFEARYDAPLVGVARNHDSQVYGFLQFPPEQWEGLFGSKTQGGATA